MGLITEPEQIETGIWTLYIEKLSTTTNDSGFINYGPGETTTDLVYALNGDKCRIYYPKTVNVLQSIHLHHSQLNFP